MNETERVMPTEIELAAKKFEYLANGALLSNVLYGYPARQRLWWLAAAALREQAEREKGCEWCTGELEPACSDCKPPWPEARCSSCERIKKYSLQKRIREEDSCCRKCGKRLEIKQG